MNLDRFQYKEEKEPEVCCHCAYCEDAILEGDEIVAIGVESVMVHSDCFLEYIIELLECVSGYAEKDWTM